jgi:Na+-transporting methylmalonyl-CoA/oxaloacetate decarboxylase gamma subunit
MLTSSGVAILIVFSALTILVIAFYGFSYFSTAQKKRELREKRRKEIRQKRKEQRAKGIHEPILEPEITEADVYITAETSAVIAAALHLYLVDLHNHENPVMTIKRIEKRYSPWNSKIYGLTNLIR